MSRRERNGRSDRRRNSLDKKRRKPSPLKDRIHDVNDILLAVVIILVAALIVAWRLKVILEYPSTLAENSKSTATSESTATLPESPEAPVEVLA